MLPTIFLLILGMKLMQGGETSPLDPMEEEFGVFLLGSETPEERLSRFQMMLQQFPDPMDKLLILGEKKKIFNSVNFPRSPFKQLPPQLQLIASNAQAAATEAPATRLPVTSTSTSTLPPTSSPTTTSTTSASTSTTTSGTTRATSASTTPTTTTTTSTTTTTPSTTLSTTSKRTTAATTSRMASPIPTNIPSTAVPTSSAPVNKVAAEVARVDCKPSARSSRWAGIPDGICASTEDLDSVCAATFAVFEASQSPDCVRFSGSWCCYVPELKKN